MSKEKDKARGNETDSSIPSILPRLHLPGHRSRHSHDQGNDGYRRHLHRHRHTRSDIPSSLRAETTSPESAEGFSTANETETLSTVDTYTNGLTADSISQSSSRVPGQSMLNRISTNLTTYKHHPRHHNQHLHQHHNHHHHHQHSTSDVVRRGPPTIHRRTTSETVESHRDRLSPTATTTTPSQTEIERLLARAARTKLSADANLTDSHVQHLTMQLAKSNLELRTTLTTSTHTASDLMRRLDEAHESLQITASSLLDTISSFHELCQHSGELVTNFERKAQELDDSTRTQLARQKKAIFDERAARVEKLDARAAVADERAETLSRRLENCRIIVANFRSREETKRRAWKGILIGSLWGCICVFAGIVLGLSVWYYRSLASGIKYDVGKAVELGLNAAGRGGSLAKVEFRGAVHQGYESVYHNETGDGTRGDSQRLESVPADVRDVLADIARRQSGDTADMKDGGSTSPLPSSLLQEENQQQQQQPQRRSGTNSRLEEVFQRLEL